jgi:hypothetical protein
MITTPIANPGELHFGQGVHHDDLQGLHYDQADMHTQYLKIQEDIEIPKVLAAKKKPKSIIHMEIEITVTISYGLKPGQGVLHCVLQSLHYNLGDMHTLTPKTLEDMAFQNSHLFWKNLESFPSLETELLSSVWTLETNTFLALKFF